ncbi:hypothetical protein [Trichormus azollae]|jgi:hypothetical protein|uniref:Uncharacterized protein n=1 Tax=Nostoc azollae (strain 0708) TaxID=551115 RepID=D7E5P9_NOSA0|nr:hypothetical protein [Trichormus azollae]ADI66308.1 hypothetical protein Aazo_5343 ['Nostoc azollae' 0708]
MVKELQLPALENNEAVASCEELLKSGYLEIWTADRKTQADTRIANRYYNYLIWTAIAVKLLEKRQEENSIGNFETTPEEIEELLSGYLKSIIT